MINTTLGTAEKLSPDPGVGGDEIFYNPPSTLISLPHYNISMLTLSNSEVSLKLEGEGGVDGDCDQRVIHCIGLQQRQGEGEVKRTLDGRTEVLVGWILAVLDATVSSALRVDTNDRDKAVSKDKIDIV